MNTTEEALIAFTELENYHDDELKTEMVKFNQLFHKLKNQQKGQRFLRRRHFPSDNQ